MKPDLIQDMNTQETPSDDAPTIDCQAALAMLDEALAKGAISSDACRNIRAWLTEPRYRQYQAQVCRHIEDARWQELDDLFWKIIPFGTGGRRGRMYPIGSNAINDRTIGESAQGLAAYVRQHREGDGELSCAIAFDTRHRSEHFARLCSEIMAAAGFKVYLLDQIRSTPELSFLVRHKKCSCGIMVTASHNPPSDNAVKVYWSSGGQVLPPHDAGVIEQVMNVGDIDRADYDRAVADGRIVVCTHETDAAFVEQVKAQGFPGPRRLKIIYSPLHGVGETAVAPALRADGFEDVEIYADHRRPDGDFPNVPDHIANPENPAVFTPIIQRARRLGADLILATDPDCDRLGCAAPRTRDSAGPWGTFTGNQIAALLADYILARRKAAGRLSEDHYLVKTLVTTELVRRIGDSYSVRTHGNLHVGFKWIGGEMDTAGADKFVFGCEESHGYLVGQYARDKDGAVAAMLMAELAAWLKAEGKSLHEKLDSLYRRHGYHAERLKTTRMEGSAGMERMKTLMGRFRTDPPERLGGLPVEAVRDYLLGTVTHGEEPSPLDAPVGDLVILDLAEPGNYVAVRPSGTEPKVKFYLFALAGAESSGDLDAVKQQMNQRLANMSRDLDAYCG